MWQKKHRYFELIIVFIVEKALRLLVIVVKAFYGIEKL